MLISRDTEGMLSISNLQMGHSRTRVGRSGETSPVHVDPARNSSSAADSVPISTDTFGSNVTRPDHTECERRAGK